MKACDSCVANGQTSRCDAARVEGPCAICRQMGVLCVKTDGTNGASPVQVSRSRYEIVNSSQQTPTATHLNTSTRLLMTLLVVLFLLPLLLLLKRTNTVLLHLFKLPPLPLDRTRISLDTSLALASSTLVAHMRLILFHSWGTKASRHLSPKDLQTVFSFGVRTRRTSASGKRPVDPSPPNRLSRLAFVS